MVTGQSVHGLGLYWYMGVGRSTPSGLTNALADTQSHMYWEEIHRHSSSDKYYSLFSTVYQQHQEILMRWCCVIKGTFEMSHEIMRCIGEYHRIQYHCAM